VHNILINQFDIGDDNYMTLFEYITNPGGKGSSAFSSTELKNSLNFLYDLLSNKIKHIWYLKNNRYAICHISIPSKTFDEMKYDVVFEFDLLSVTDRESNINNANMTFFSNSPSFVYTYAYVYKEKDILCRWLSSKYDNKILAKAPVVRNSYKIINYEKSIYLAAKYIMSNNRNRLDNIKNTAINITNYNKVSIIILTQEEIEKRYKLLHEKNKKIKEDKNNKSVDKPKKQKNTSRSINKSNKVAKVKKTKKI